VILPRVLTSILLIPLVVAAIWYGTLPYFLFVLGISLLCLWEFSLMAEEGGYPNQLFLSFLGGIAMIMALFLDGASPWGPVRRSPSPLFILVLLVFFVFVREFFRRDKGHSFLRIITTISNVIICSFLLGHLLLLRDLRLVAGEGFQFIGREIVFFLFFVIWALDIGAWAIGKWVGRIPFAPRISPKKTWEGSVGGLILACLLGWFLREVFLSHAFSRFEAVLYAFIIGITAQVSDLAESLMKRSFGVKNSSELLPGHGGILDRFDSFIFSAPLFYYLLLGTSRFQ